MRCSLGGTCRFRPDSVVLRWYLWCPSGPSLVPVVSASGAGSQPYPYSYTCFCALAPASLPVPPVFSLSYSLRHKARWKEDTWQEHLS